MDEAQFCQRLADQGYDEPELKTYEPHTDGPMHVHDFSVMLLVIKGEFTLAQEDTSMTYGPGESFELPAGVLHVERTGPQGAQALVGKKHNPPAN